mgnify:CR=1 FL=1
MAKPHQVSSLSEQQSQPQRARTRICYFVHSGGMGGAPLSLLYLLQQLDLEKYQPVVVFLSESPLRQAYQRLGIDTMVARGMTYFSHNTGESLSLRNPRGWLHVPMYLTRVWQTNHLVRRLRPQIVHLNSSTLAAQAIGAKLVGARVVWHIREHVTDGLLGIRKALLKWVARHFTDAIIVILNGDVDRLGAPEKSHVIYNFVDFKVFDRGLRDHSLVTNERRTSTVVMLGGVSQVKGTLELVQAYPLVKQKIGPVRFLVAGYSGLEFLTNRASTPKRLLRRIFGSYRYVQQLHTYVQQHCDQGVVFCGVIDDVPHLLAQVDLVVFPSTTPHFARPIVEAGAMAIPVVASDLEGPRELVRHGETGLLVPPGDPAALAEAIARILADENLAHDMGEAGFAQAQRLFRAEANSQATFRVYEALLQKPAPTKSGQDNKP